MKNFIDLTTEHWGLVDIDTYAAQLHLFSKQKKLIFRKYLESQGIAIISLGGDMGRADLANKTQIEALINTLHTKSNLDELQIKGELDLDLKQKGKL
jgi:hypothetical protein